MSETAMMKSDLVYTEKTTNKVSKILLQLNSTTTESMINHSLNGLPNLHP